MDFDAWIRQPTTLHGLAVMAGGFAGLASHVATGNQMVDGGFAIVAYFLTHLVVDDNSVPPAAPPVQTHRLRLKHNPHG